EEEASKRWSTSLAMADHTAIEITFNRGDRKGRRDKLFQVTKSGTRSGAHARTDANASHIGRHAGRHASRSVSLCLRGCLFGQVPVRETLLFRQGEGDDLVVGDLRSRE